MSGFKYKWIDLGRWNLMLWPFRLSATLNGWKIMEGNRWESFVELLNSNPLYLVGLKRWGKYT